LANVATTSCPVAIHAVIWSAPIVVFGITTYMAIRDIFKIKECSMGIISQSPRFLMVNAEIISRQRLSATEANS
jgi:hypothetical protein